MWAADKTTNLARQCFDPLPAELIASIRSLWVGEGTPGDRSIAGRGIQQLHEQGCWIACDCRVDEHQFPLMAPAYLRAFGTHYLRRLYGKTRPRHAKTCIFYAEPWLGSDRVIEHQSPICPDGYFEIADPLERHLDEGDTVSLHDSVRPARPYTDRLRLQLWRLMERARLNEIAPPNRTIRPSYAHEYAKLKDAAALLHVGAGHPLSEVFETVPFAIERRSIYAKIRRLMKEGSDYTGQGFLAFMAKDVDRRRVVTQRVTIAPLFGIDVVKGGTPYLVILLVGRDPTGWLKPLRATAQPILSGRRFFPFFSEEERSWIDDLIGEQYRLRRRAPRLRRAYEGHSSMQMAKNR